MVVYFGAVVKNISKSFPNFVKCLNEILQVIPDMQVFIYEDGSTDGTKNILQQIAGNQNPNIHIRSEDVDWLAKSRILTWNNKPCRIECIATARNHLMEMMEAHGMGTRAEDVCIVIDPDVPANFPIRTNRMIEIALNYPENVDALFANGVSMYNGSYYDIFAYRDSTFMFDYDVLGEEKGKMRIDEKTQTVKNRIGSSNQLIPVMSAFGGIGIYRGTSIRGKRYSAFPTKALNTVYRKFVTEHPDHPEVPSLKYIQSNVQTHRHGALMGYYPFEKKEEGGYFYHNCWGYNFPIVCEHVNFHAEMIVDGKSKLFIDPSLVYVSDH